MTQTNKTVIPQDAFHDASLLRLEVNFESNSAELAIRTQSGHVVLLAEEIRALRLGRDMPWGRSQSINKASIIESSAGVTELAVELQSGDELRLSARRFSAR